MSLRRANMCVFMATVHAAQLLLCWVCSLSWIWLPRVGLSNLWWATFSKTPVALNQFVVAASPSYCTKNTQGVLQRGRMVLSAVRSGWKWHCWLARSYSSWWSLFWTASFNVSPVVLVHGWRFAVPGGEELCSALQLQSCASDRLNSQGSSHILRLFLSVIFYSCEKLQVT